MGAKPIGVVGVVLAASGLLFAAVGSGSQGSAASDAGTPLTQQQRFRACLDAARRLDDGGLPIPVLPPMLADGGFAQSRRPAICNRPGLARSPALARLCGPLPDAGPGDGGS